LKNIERDNTEKDADLVAANREIEAVSCNKHTSGFGVNVVLMMVARSKSVRTRRSSRRGPGPRTGPH
jgi:hypothetical protein